MSRSVWARNRCSKRVWLIVWLAEQHIIGPVNHWKILELKSFPELNNLTTSILHDSFRRYKMQTWDDTYETLLALAQTARVSVIFIMTANGTASCYLEAAFEKSALKGTEVIILEHTQQSSINVKYFWQLTNSITFANDYCKVEFWV